MMLGEQRGNRFVRQAEQHHGDGGAGRRQRHQHVRSPFCLQRRQSERAADGADADDAEQDAVKLRSAGDLAAGDQRQQRPKGARKQKEAGSPRQASRADADCAGNSAGPPTWLWPKLSAGSSVPGFFAVRHHSSATITATLQIALSQNGAAMPSATMMRPPSAGPSAREIFTPTLLAAIAAGSSSRGTSCVTTDCQAGEVSAPAALMRKVNSKQIERRRQMQADHRRIDRGHCRRHRLEHDQESALVENIGERAGRQREHEHRQRRRGLHQRHDQRIGIEIGHQPARRRAVHPAADIGDQRRRPDHREGRSAKRRPR